MEDVARLQRQLRSTSAGGISASVPVTVSASRTMALPRAMLNVTSVVLAHRLHRRFDTRVEVARDPVEPLQRRHVAATRFTFTRCSWRPIRVNGTQRAGPGSCSAKAACHQLLQRIGPERGRVLEPDLPDPPALVLRHLRVQVGCDRAHAAAGHRQEAQDSRQATIRAPRHAKTATSVDCRPVPGHHDSRAQACKAYATPYA
jgi:hypothetical protein